MAEATTDAKKVMIQKYGNSNSTTPAWKDIQDFKGFEKWLDREDVFDDWLNTTSDFKQKQKHKKIINLLTPEQRKLILENDPKKVAGSDEEILDAAEKDDEYSIESQFADLPKPKEKQE